MLGKDHARPLYDERCNGKPWKAYDEYQFTSRDVLTWHIRDILGKDNGEATRIVSRTSSVRLRLAINLGRDD